MNTKIKFVVQKILFLVVIIIGIGSGCSSLSPQNADLVEKITLGAYSGDTTTLVWIAENQGYFLDNGLEVIIKEYEAGKLATDALINGDVDIATAAEFVLVSESFNHDELRVLGSIATARVNELIARQDHGIQSPLDLKGKKIGATLGSAGEFFLGRFLLFNHISFQDVTVVDLNPSEIVDSIKKGNIDAALTWDPNIYQIKKQLGENGINWPGQSGQDMYFILIAKDTWIENNSSAIIKFLKAIAQAEEFVKENEEAAQLIIEDHFDLEPEYCEYIWPKHSFVLTFPQALLIAMEDEARWRIENNLTEQTTIPNYLNFFYFDGIEGVKPEAISVIR